MRQFFPDKPVRASYLILADLKAGEWLAQAKMDGWRCIIEWDGTRPTFTSRHHKPIPATLMLASAVTEWLRGRDPLVIDAEWMSRRDGQPERLYVFDLLAERGQWLGAMPPVERFDGLTDVYFSGDPPPVELITLPEWRLSHYAEFFERSKRIDGCEGIVLKHVKSPYIGSPRASVDNPLWFKCKWRDGEDGQLRVA